MSDTAEATRPPKPEAPTVNLDAIPLELRDRRQWVLWRFAWRVGKKNRNGEWAKMPYQPNGKEAETDNPKTWSTFEEVSKAYRSDLRSWSGIGFVFSADDPFVGVDLDGCRRDDGTLVAWSSGLRGKFAAPGVPDSIEIVKRLPTYAEVSPSGTGFKLIGIGKKPGTRCEMDAPDFEHHGIGIYEDGRYFTLTGCRVPGTPATVNDISDALASFYASIFGKTQPKADGNGKPKSAGGSPTDDDILRAIGASHIADKIRRLLDGDTAGYSSPSEADSALAFHLAFWTRDAEQIARIMLASKLCREKWKRNNYLTKTIAKALEGVTDHYDWDRGSVPPLHIASGRTEVVNGRRLVIKHGADIRWCDAWGKWLVWDGRRWASDQARLVDKFSKDVSDGLWKEIGDYAGTRPDEDAEKVLKEMIRFAKSTGSAHGIEAMLKLARSEPGIGILPERLDRDPWSLNLHNGTLDLRTGKLRPHRRDDYLTKLCPVTFDPDASCPFWHEYLARVTAADETLISYIRKASGMALTGVVQDHVLFFLYGTGAKQEAPASSLYTSYKLWAEASGENVVTQTAFGIALGERGFESDRFTSGVRKGKAKWVGIGLRANVDPSAPQRGE